MWNVHNQTIQGREPRLIPSMPMFSAVILVALLLIYDFPAISLWVPRLF
jgi:hypothetical protein